MSRPAPWAPSSSTPSPASTAACSTPGTSVTRGLIRSTAASSPSRTPAMSTGSAPSHRVRTKLWYSSRVRSFSSSRAGSRRSPTRIARRAALSSYAGPMPRPVVPMAAVPRAASRARSSAAWYGRMSGHASLTRTRSAAGTPHSASMRISSTRAVGDSTTPCPIRHCTPSCITPEGTRCSTVRRPPMTRVCPALCPPWKRATTAARPVSRSTILPLPSSPHCMPTTATAPVIPSLPSPPATTRVAHPRRSRPPTGRHADPGPGRRAPPRPADAGRPALHAI